LRLQQRQRPGTLRNAAVSPVGHVNARINGPLTNGLLSVSVNAVLHQRQRLW
jgi:hypothetical protein